MRSRHKGITGSLASGGTVLAEVFVVWVLTVSSGPYEEIEVLISLQPRLAQGFNEVVSVGLSLRGFL